jgi:hypothetical protein
MHISATTATAHIHHHDGHAHAAALEGRIPNATQLAPQNEDTTPSSPATLLTPAGRRVDVLA